MVVVVSFLIPTVAPTLFLRPKPILNPILALILLVNALPAAPVALLQNPLLLASTHSGTGTETETETDMVLDAEFELDVRPPAYTMYTSRAELVSARPLLVSSLPASQSLAPPVREKVASASPVFDIDTVRISLNPYTGASVLVSEGAKIEEVHQEEVNEKEDGEIVVVMANEKVKITQTEIRNGTGQVKQVHLSQVTPKENLSRFNSTANVCVKPHRPKLALPLCLP